MNKHVYAAAVYLEVDALQCLDRCSRYCSQCSKWSIKGKQDIVNDNCTVCDLIPWCALAGLM